MPSAIPAAVSALERSWGSVRGCGLRNTEAQPDSTWHSASPWRAEGAAAVLWDGAEWTTLKRTPRPAFFASLRRKRKAAAVLDSLHWFQRSRGAPVAKVAEFLRKLNLDNHNVGERVALWNRVLRPRVKIQKVKWSAGDAPWCGTRLAFRRIWNHLNP